MLSIQTQVSDQRAILWCTGRIVRGEEATILRNTVLAQDSESVVIVLSNVDEIDAGGLGVLVELEQWATSNHRKLKLLNPVRRVCEVLEATHLYSVIEVCRTDAAHLAA